jgi:HAD superfamily hydrolase (TIGR01484 family)
VKKTNNLVRLCSAIRVKALFLDFDGTISPLNVPISESAVATETLAVLHKIREQIPIAIITNKSLNFVEERTPFAHAWAALGGLITKIGNVTIQAPCLRNLEHLTSALRYAKSLCNDDLTLEEKTDPKGRVVAFSVDWRQSKNPRKAKKAALKIFAYCETLPIFAVKYEKQPFFDVFPCKVNKGEALLQLKEELGLRNGVLFMGDSTIDNSAFRKADLAIGVRHAETPTSLACSYFVKFDDVADFLNTLLDNNFTFNPRLPKITHR